MNVTNLSSLSTMFESSAIVDEFWIFLLATRAELFLFCAAVAAYLLLFGNASPKGSKRNAAKTKRIKVSEEDRRDDESAGLHGGAAVLSLDDAEKLERSFNLAFESGDHRQALRCWNSLKRSERMPAVSLVNAVESMQRFKKDPSLVARELKAFFKKFPTQCKTSQVNDLLESLAKRLDSELVEKVVDMLPSISMKPDQRTFEILLTMNFTTRNFSEVRALIGDMASEGVQLTTKANIVAVKTALKTGSFDEATRHFKELKSLWRTAAESPSVSTAPRHIVSQLIDLACKEHQLIDFLPLLDGVPISEDAVHSMLSECIRRKDPALTKRVEKLVREQGHQLSDATYTLLVKSLSSDHDRVQGLFDEVAQQGNAISSDFALALLAFCAQTRALDLADSLFERMEPKTLPVLSAFIRFYAESEQHEKACDVYEKHLLVLRQADASSGTEGRQQQQQQSPLFLDARIERSLMSAALRCGRHELAKNFLEASPSDVAKHITMIRNCASAGNLKGAMQVFDTLHKSGTEVNSVVYNTVLDACVECRDLAAAEQWMQRTKQAGLADVVSYNTLIKAYLQNDRFDLARGLMEDMRKEGLQPNRVTFNELVNGLVTRGLPTQRHEIWTIIREMKGAGVKPNQVTCSILLKSLNSYSKEADILETMDLIGTMDEPMDEVLLSSVVEACVRIGKPELLAEKLKQLQGAENLSVSGSHTFGSLIKAYGHARDINGVWRCWKEMRSRHIRPTSITLGCMVEAVVSNGDTEGAYELIHQMQDDDRCRDALNAVIYCSVLKGFTREKKMQRVWSVYEEMLQRKVDLSIVTYNTLLDACARCGKMDRAPSILEDMTKHSIRPNLITYSTMVKGHCQAGDIERGFALLEQMKAETKLKPDEIMYNSLLDGCAQNNLVDEGLALLERMQSENVQPSNFTLSLLVKLMNRCRKLDTAFTLVDEISKKYHFRPNVHVYTNLIQACIANRQLQRGMETFTRMLGERIRPENRTYSILVRASLQQNQLEQACGLLRAALSLPGAKECLPGGAPVSLAACSQLDHAVVSEALQALTDKGRVQDLAVPLLSDVKRHAPTVRLDMAAQRRVMSAGMAGEEPRQSGVVGGGGGGGGYSQRQAGGNGRSSKGDGKGGRGGKGSSGGSWRS